MESEPIEAIQEEQKESGRERRRARRRLQMKKGGEGKESRGRGRERMEERIMLRLPAEELERVDALIPYVEEATRQFAVSRITRSSVIRAAFMRGLEAMEAEQRAKKTKE